MDLILNTNTISFTIELCDIHYVGIYEKKAKLKNNCHYKHFKYNYHNKQ